MCCTFPAPQHILGKFNAVVLVAWDGSSLDKLTRGQESVIPCAPSGGHPSNSSPKQTQVSTTVVGKLHPEKLLADIMYVVY